MVVRLGYSRRNARCHAAQNLRGTYGNVSRRYPSRPVVSAHQMLFCKRYCATTGFSVLRSGNTLTNQPSVRFFEKRGGACGSTSASKESFVEGTLVFP